MICGMTYYQILWYFLIYSFGGWIVEVIFHAVAIGKIINRGFLNGPVCPVYGFGVLSVFAMINTTQGNGVALNDGIIFVFGILLATIVELIAGWLLDICFHARWWDYSDKPLNFHGYICLEFSIIWGLAILLVVKVFQKVVENHSATLTQTSLGMGLLVIFYFFYMVDFIVTVAVIQGFNKKLDKLNQLQKDLRIVSDKISVEIGEKTIETAQTVEEGKVQAHLAKVELYEIAEAKKNEQLENMHREKERLLCEYRALEDSFRNHQIIGTGRLIKAFPNMKHRDHQEIVNNIKKMINED